MIKELNLSIFNFLVSAFSILLGRSFPHHNNYFLKNSSFFFQYFVFSFFIFKSKPSEIYFGIYDGKS